ncbi:MgtC/SapB family protein [Candidatus Kaiserbacteria bacterium]|nr:MgtC/SapB family protein [Candidatus Kaiserbacteria bacterium]
MEVPLWCKAKQSRVSGSTLDCFGHRPRKDEISPLTNVIHVLFVDYGLYFIVLHMNGVEQFIDTDTVMFLKLLLAMVLGGIIGTERSVIARQPVGTRTFGLVSLGACMFILVGNYVDIAFIGILNFDPLRLAAAVVMGMGFIGGGLMFFRGESLHGATTAAGMWVATAVGIAVGFGMYSLSIFATVLALIMFTGMWYVEDRFKHWFRGNHDNQHPQSPVDNQQEQH